jgi:5'(3')-deoxyribonucleotidase
MKIALDWDDTLVKFIDAVIEFHNKEYGTSLVNKDFHSYKFWEVWGGNRIEAISKIDIFFQSEYFDKIDLFEDSNEFISNLQKDNELYIITARPYHIMEKTLFAINRFFPNIFKDVFFCNQFSNIGLPRKKRDICDDLGIDMIVEDSADYANECVFNERKVYLLSRPWNITSELKPEVKRVASLKEILDSYKN